MTTPAEFLTVPDDVSAVQAFVSQVRTLCARLIANPFSTPAAEELLDLLLEEASAADTALVRVQQAVLYGPVSDGTQILTAITGRYTAPVVSAAA